jgi:sulfur carrier protein ThiS
MMTIIVNGVTRQVNFGCHSYLSVAKLLSLLSVAADSTPTVQINRQLLDPLDYAERIVQNDDRISITT